MEKPGIEPATPGLQGKALIHYTTGASQHSLLVIEYTYSTSIDEIKFIFKTLLSSGSPVIEYTCSTSIDEIPVKSTFNKTFEYRLIYS